MLNTSTVFNLAEIKRTKLLSLDCRTSLRVKISKIGPNHSSLVSNITS